VRRDDVADGRVVTARRVQVLGALTQASGVVVERAELRDALVKISGVGIGQRCDVPARRAAVLARGDDVADLGQAQPAVCAALTDRSRSTTDSS
jgi:hypothetical protein